MIHTLLHAVSEWFVREPLAAAALLLALAVAWRGRRVARFLRIFSQRAALPEFDIEVSREPSQSTWFNASVTVMAVKNPAIFIGGRLRIFDCDDECLGEISLRKPTSGLMELGQGFRLPISVRCPLDERGLAKAWSYDGYIIYSDSLRLGYYHMAFAEGRRPDVQPITMLRAYGPIWAERLRALLAPGRKPAWKAERLAARRAPESVEFRRRAS